MSPTPSLFHHLRRARALMVGVVAWWALSLAAAVITPALAADPADAPLHQICSALGVQAPADQNTAPPAEAPHVGWHCVLCLGGAVPLAAGPSALPPGESASSFAQSSATPALYRRHAGPAPARGPPAA
jgi:hypothetical protein